MSERRHTDMFITLGLPIIGALILFISGLLAWIGNDKITDFGNKFNSIDTNLKFFHEENTAERKTYFQALTKIVDKEGSDITEVKADIANLRVGQAQCCPKIQVE